MLQAGEQGAVRYGLVAPRTTAYSPSQYAVSTTTLTVAAVRTRASALAAHTRARRGSKSSWLLIDPVLQSWPTNVVPATNISAPSKVTTVSPEPNSRSICRSIDWV